MSKPTWESAATELIAKRTGTALSDLHYRAYLRAIVDNQSSLATELRTKYVAANQACIDLLDRMGLAAYKDSNDEAH